MTITLTDAQVDAFLTQFVKGYLHHDIDTLMIRSDPAPGRSDGACGYPLLMTVFSGIELLGALTSASTFQRRGKNDEYFRSYWQGFLYTSGPEKDVGPALYRLARHGIAHGFMVKGSIDVDKTPGAESKHLTHDQGATTIHVLALGRHFVDSYAGWEGNHLANNRSAVRDRLGEILDSNDQVANDKANSDLLQKLPPPRMPVLGPNVSAVGYTITSSPTGAFKWQSAPEEMEGQRISGFSSGSLAPGALC